METNRKVYPSDVTDEEWAFAAPYLTLMDEGAPQRTYPLGEMFNALRWLVRTGAHWRMMPHDLPPWPAVYKQTRRWLAAGVFEAMVHDLGVLLRWGCCCAWQRDERLNLQPLSSIAVLSNPRLRVEREGVTMGPSGARGARCMWLLTRWGTCWPCT